MTPCFTARADARRNTCLTASGSGSKPAISNCIRARRGSCIARTSIGPKRSRHPVHLSRLHVPPPQGDGQVRPRLRELLTGGQPRRPQGDAADNPGLAGPTEERQERGRSLGHARPDPEGMAAILRPFPRLGAQVGLATREPSSGRMADAQAQEAGGPYTRAAETLKRLAQRQPRAFVHWSMGYQS